LKNILISHFTDIHSVGADSFPSAGGQRSIMNYVTSQFCVRASNRRILIRSGVWILFSVYCSSILQFETEKKMH
jgi:hypothetical protein